MKSKALKQNKDEIIWNIINSLIAGGLVIAGACAGGNLTLTGLGTAFAAAAVVALTKFRDYWLKEEHEYSKKFFTFI
jgi:hypothetical protein